MHSGIVLKRASRRHDGCSGEHPLMSPEELGMALVCWADNVAMRNALFPRVAF
jgi:hypothetical protein